MLPMWRVLHLQSRDIDKRPDDGFRLYGVCAATQGHETGQRGPLLALDHVASSGPCSQGGAGGGPQVRLEAVQLGRPLVSLAGAMSCFSPSTWEVAVGFWSCRFYCS